MEKRTFVQFQADWMKELAKRNTEKCWLAAPKLSVIPDNDQRYYVAFHYSCIISINKCDFYINPAYCAINKDASNLVKRILAEKDYKRATATGVSIQGFTEYKAGNVIAYFNPKLLKYFGKTEVDYYIELCSSLAPAIIRHPASNMFLGILCPIRVSK